MAGLMRGPQPLMLWLPFFSPPPFPQLVPGLPGAARGRGLDTATLRGHHEPCGCPQVFAGV